MKTESRAPTAHTPGPWHVKPYKDSRIVEMSRKFGLATGDVPDHYEIFTEAEFDHTPKLHGPLYVGQVYQEANARLIAAAPELLASLESLTQRIAQALYSGEIELSATAAFRDANLVALEVIRKVRGAQ